MSMIYFRINTQVYCCCSFRETLIIYFQTLPSWFTCMVHVWLVWKPNLLWG